MWRTCREAGRPWPVICPDDDVIDYMIMEAVHIKVLKEQQKAEKQAAANQWKEDTSELDQFR